MTTATQPRPRPLPRREKCFPLRRVAGPCRKCGRSVDGCCHVSFSQVFYPDPASHNRRYCLAHYCSAVSCTNCGAEIPVLLRRTGRRTCSAECLAARLAELGTDCTAQRQCEVCGKAYRKRSDKPTNIFCSPECKAVRLEEIGPIALNLRFLACRFVAVDHAGNH